MSDEKEAAAATSAGAGTGPKVGAAASSLSAGVAAAEAGASAASSASAGAAAPAAASSGAAGEQQHQQQEQLQPGAGLFGSGIKTLSSHHWRCSSSMCRITVLLTSSIRDGLRYGQSEGHSATVLFFIVPCGLQGPL